MELPAWLEGLLIALQVAAFFFFLWLIWPLIKGEQWKEKFIKNKQALSILIVFILVFIFIYGLTALFDWIAPIETLK